MRAAVMEFSPPACLQYWQQEDHYQPKLRAPPPQPQPGPSPQPQPEPSPQPQRQARRQPQRQHPEAFVIKGLRQRERRMFNLLPHASLKPKSVNFSTTGLCVSDGSRPCIACWFLGLHAV